MLRNQNKLVAAAATALTFWSGGVAMARTPCLERYVEGSMQELAQRAFVNKELGGRLSVHKMGSVALMRLVKKAPTQYGSDRGGRYVVEAVAAYSKRHGIDFNHLYQEEIREGQFGPNGQLENGTEVIIELNNRGGSVAEVTRRFESKKPLITEATVLPRDGEMRLTDGTLHGWQLLADRMETVMQADAPTGPLGQISETGKVYPL